MDKLRSVNDSVESIQTVSHWLTYHQKHSRMYIDVWKAELAQGKEEIAFFFFPLVGAGNLMMTQRTHRSGCGCCMSPMSSSRAIARSCRIS